MEPRTSDVIKTSTAETKTKTSICKTKTESKTSTSETKTMTIETNETIRLTSISNKLTESQKYAASVKCNMYCKLYDIWLDLLLPVIRFCAAHSFSKSVNYYRSHLTK